MWPCCELCWTWVQVNPASNQWYSTPKTRQNKKSFWDPSNQPRNTTEMNFFIFKKACFAGTLFCSQNSYLRQLAGDSTLVPLRGQILQVSIKCKLWRFLKWLPLLYFLILLLLNQENVVQLIIGWGSLGEDGALLWWHLHNPWTGKTIICSLYPFTLTKPSFLRNT